MPISCALLASQPLKCWQNSIPLNQHPEWMVWTADVWCVASQLPQWTKLLDPSELPSPIPFISLSISWLPTIIRLNCFSHITDHAVILPSLLSFVPSFLATLLTYFTVWHLVIFLSQPVSWNYQVIIRLQTPPHCVQVTPGLDLPAFLPFPPMIPELVLSHDLSSDAALALSLSPNSSQNPRLPPALWVY